MAYIATINVPGYLPTDDDPPVFDTAAEAWWYLYHERCEADRDALPAVPEHDCPWRGNPLGAPFCAVCDDADNDHDSETAEKLARQAKTDLICDFERVGTVYGDTPGYTGDHDLGLAYSVTEAQD